MTHRTFTISKSREQQSIEDIFVDFQLTTRKDGNNRMLLMNEDDYKLEQPLWFLFENKIYCGFLNSKSYNDNVFLNFIDSNKGEVQVIYPSINQEFKIITKQYHNRTVKYVSDSCVKLGCYLYLRGFEFEGCYEEDILKYIEDNPEVLL